MENRKRSLRGVLRLQRRDVVSGFVLLATLGVQIPGAAQDRARPAPPVSSGTVTIVPNLKYDAHSIREVLLGSTWRSVWTRPVEATVFGFDTYGGGVEWEERGGGGQSI